MSFAYEAYDRTGTQDAGVIDASTIERAREELLGRGLFITKLTHTADAHAKAETEAPGRLLGARRLKDVASLARELSVLVSTGTPVADSIAAIERQTKDEDWRAVVTSLRQRVERGESLAAAMAAHKQFFDPVCRSLVDAGEASGELDVMLGRLAALLRQQQAARSGAIGALIYPAVLITLSTGASIVMLVTVSPRFAGMFESLNASVPASTQALVATGEALRSYWWAFLLGMATLVTGGFAWIRSAPGRRFLDGVLVSAPIAGPLVRGLALARLGRLLGSLLSAGLTLVDALRLVRRSMTNTRYRELVDHMLTSITDGDSLAASLSDSPLVTASFAEAVRNAENAGRLGPVLENLADYMDEDNIAAVRSLTKTLEPLIVTGMGVVIGFMAISMFLPLFDLTSATGAGP